MKSRLQKILSERGVCSRRKAEEYIKSRAVKVNGITASLGDSADDESDEITLFGKRIERPDKKTYLMLNKPRGYVTTMSDEMGRPVVFSLVSDVGTRVYPVGGLDMYSEGLLLMADDGQLANKLTHPSHNIYKTYLVNIGYPKGSVFDGDAKELLSRPMEMDGRELAPAICRTEARLEDGCILTISIREGRNRQIRRMCEMCGFKVRSLKRVAVGEIKLGGLKSGCYRRLTDKEIMYLKSL